MRGPGKYDDACTAVRVATDAQGVVLIIVNGHSGSGFSVQGTLAMLRDLPTVLRTIADQIERDNSEGGSAPLAPPFVKR
jgi:hypothetical protein